MQEEETPNQRLPASKTSREEITPTGDRKHTMNQEDCYIQDQEYNAKEETEGK